MEEEIEDLIGDIKYTGSQNSNLYSCDFTDSSSDQNNSSGKETYVLAYDSEDSDSNYDVDKSSSAINLFETTFLKPLNSIKLTEARKVNKSASTSLQTFSFIEETFTQTSRTILELADTERRGTSLETQTSFISISENKKVEYKIQYCGDAQFTRSEIIREFDNIQHDKEINDSNDKETNNCYCKEIENGKFEDECSNTSSSDFIEIVDSKEDQSIDKDIFEDSPKTDADFEADSLLDYDLRDKEIPRDCVSSASDVSKSVDNEVEELYKKLSETIDVLSPDLSNDLVLKRCGTLTPLAEEPSVKKESLIDITPNIAALCETVDHNHKEILDKIKSFGVSVEISPDKKQAVTVTEEKGFKLPPIKNQSCPNSPHVNLLFTVNTSKPLSKAETLPCLSAEKAYTYDNWYQNKIDHAAGESPRISSRPENSIKPLNTFQLPPIEGEIKPSNSKNNMSKEDLSSEDVDEISIIGRIKELKKSAGKSKGPWTRLKRYPSPGSPRSPGSRSSSPQTSSSPADAEVEAAERGGDSLCGDLLRRLRCNNWLEVADTLDDVPRALEKFWSVITEQRIADIIRQVSVHIESPRTQVARSACNTLGAVLKNTNYTKKPEFYEAVSLLLVKAGSFNRAVRRAANVALDEVVCGVELGRAVAALCVHGVDHKSPLVRCAAARLLVVCTAIAGGGRELLRARPASAAAARRQALQAMAAMLEDKNTDVRKFAERLYIMLRPLPNFEAFFLSDVDVELASRQMKRFDLLMQKR